MELSADGQLDGADILVQHLGKKEGGLDKLAGKKIALFITTRRSERADPSASERAKMHGFDLQLIPCVPGVEQKSALQVRQSRPDFVMLWVSGA
jgi:branched-chain amino acid transport system substrate-binding protein